MVAAGLMTWFTPLVVVVRFIPHHIGPIFFASSTASLDLSSLASPRSAQ
jgi:hypothetical protein